MALVGCSQQGPETESPPSGKSQAGSSLGTLRHRGKSYDLRQVLTAEGDQFPDDPFLRELTKETTFLADRYNERD